MATTIPGAGKRHGSVSSSSKPDGAPNNHNISSSDSQSVVDLSRKMEDEAELLRADEHKASTLPQIKIKTQGDLSDGERRATEPMNKRSTTILACLACAFLSFVLGVTVGHSWQGASQVPIGHATTGSSVISASECECPKVYPNESTIPAALRMTKPRRKTIVLLGDSVTMYASDVSSGGFGLRMSNEYVRSADVLNRGITIYNTKGFLSAAIPVLEDEMSTWLTPSVVVIWFGVNDATVVGGKYQSQHVPVANYKKNLIEMVTRVQKASPTTKVILMTPMTVDIGRLPTNRNNEQSGIYAAACREVLDHVQNVTMLDMYKYMMDTYPNATDRGALQVDGLHLNGEGHKVVAQFLMKEIEKLYPGFSGHELQVPDWDALNDKYPDNVKEGKK